MTPGPPLGHKVSTLALIVVGTLVALVGLSAAGDPHASVGQLFAGLGTLTIGGGMLAVGARRT